MILSLSILTPILFRHALVRAYNEMTLAEPLIAAGESFTLAWSNSSSQTVDIWLCSSLLGALNAFELTVTASISASDQATTLIIPPSLVYADIAYYFMIMADPEEEWSPSSNSFYVSGLERQASATSAADATTRLAAASASSEAAAQSSASNPQDTDSSQQNLDLGVPTGAVVGIAVGCTVTGIGIGGLIWVVVTMLCIKRMKRKGVRAVQMPLNDVAEENTTTQADAPHERDMFSGTTGQDGFWVTDPHTSHPMSELQGDSR
ncbi:hypothetical protein LTR92_010025 [Exophiala xenobiotica]|nr:hypothetical protein LTR92_010025 [Exophiala xenobiotica]